MEANTLRTVRGNLNVAPLAKWGAVLASVAAPLCLVALFPLLYLFVDLLVWKGQVPGYADLPATQQKTFQDAWESRLSGQGVFPDRPSEKQVSYADAAKLLAATNAKPTGVAPADAEWEYRWQVATYAWLAVRVGPDAAEEYLKLSDVVDSQKPASPTRMPLGILSPTARERGRWTGEAVGIAAQLLPWTWRPAEGRSANTAYLTTLLAAAFVLTLLRGLLLNASAFLAAVAAGEAATRLRRTLHTHSYRLQSLAIRPEAQAEAGDVIATRAEHVQDGFVAWMTVAVRGLVQIALLAALMLAVHPWLTLSLLLLGALVWLVTGRAVARFRQDARVAARRTESRLALLRESLTVSPLVKGYMMDRFGQTRVERHLTELGRAAWRRQRGEVVSRSVLLTAAALAGMAMLYLAGRVVLGGELTVAGLMVLAAGLGTLAFSLHRWLTARVRVARANAAAAVVAEFLDRRGEPGQPVDAEFLQPLSKRLDLVGLSLREPGSGRMVLEDVTLTVPAGTKAAVVYADADEAHALAYLVARFLDPTAGEIRIDGKNIRWVTYESLRTQVCLVLEQSLTFTDTVANNIGCGDPGYSLPQIIEAAKRAHAHQFVQALPYGYETRIGEGGISLTAGQRFRLALARAMLRDPSLVVVEEPAEPMDADSIALIDDALARFQAGRTLLFLARRPATVKTADRVFVLQNGRLAAAGSHDELLTSSELYRLLHFKQSLTAPEPV